MLPSMVIFKGKRALKNLCIKAGVVVAFQLKAWNDAALTKIWIRKVLCRYSQKQHALLVWDTFSEHMTKDVAEDLQKNITVATIPGGCTSKIQPLDVCLNKLTVQEQLLQPVGVAFMQQQGAKQEPGERLKPASMQQVDDWVVQSNKLLHPEVFHGVWQSQCTGWITKPFHSLCQVAIGHDHTIWPRKECRRIQWIRD